MVDTLAFPDDRISPRRRDTARSLGVPAVLPQRPPVVFAGSVHAGDEAAGLHSGVENLVGVQQGAEEKAEQPAKEGIEA